MLRVFCLVPWLFIWPWLFGIGLVSFRDGEWIIWLVLLCVAAGCLSGRIIIFTCLLGYVWGMILVPIAWRNVSWTTYLWRVQNVVPRIETVSVGWAVDVRRWGTARLRTALPEREATLGAGMLYGDAAFQTQDKQKIRATGISHIVAVSGANIIFLLLIVRRILYRCIQTKSWRLLADKGGIIGIVILTGASASVLRAGLMLVLFGSASAFGRRATFSRLLLLSAAILIAFEPRRLLFDAGFLLSYFACTGLLHSKGKDEGNAFFEKIELKSTWYTWIWTTPFQLWFFGGITWVGLIANALVLFVVPWIQVLAIVAIILPNFPPTNWILEQCLKHIWTIVDVMSAYSQTISLSPRQAFFVMLLLYLLLTIVLIHKRMSFWTTIVSKVVDISPVEWIRRRIKSFLLVPMMFDTAPDLAVYALFSMLRSSAKDGAKRL